MTSAIKPIIAANWKMHKTVGESLDFVKGLKSFVVGRRDRQVLLAPPFTALYSVGEALRGSEIGLAAQNISGCADGACTGEISGRMLIDAGCSHVIVGHSERRTLFGESNETVRAKIGIALKSALQPIFCTGETGEERETGKTFEVLEKQVSKGLRGIGADDIRHVIIAYEPVWAIGTGKTATTSQAEEAHAFIRRLLERDYGKDAASRVPLLYGGSVKEENIGKLMAEPDINGALVGGASLDIETFGKILSFKEGV